MKAQLGSVLSGRREKPLFKVGVRWPEVIVVGVFFVGLAAIYLYGFLTAADAIGLDAAVFLLSVFALLMVMLVGFVTRFEFYKDGFVRKRLGSARQEVSWSEVGDVRYFQGRRAGSALLINANVNGRSLPFLVKGNPRNQKLGVHLNDWLKTKVKNVN